MQILTRLSESMVGIKSSVEELRSFVGKFYQDMLARLPDSGVQSVIGRSSYAHNENENDDETASMVTIKPSCVSRLSEASFKGWRDFELELRTARPYRKIVFDDPSSAFSLDETHTLTWSCLTGVSLSDISRISVVGISVFDLVTLGSEVYKHSHYKHDYCLDDDHYEYLEKSKKMRQVLGSNTSGLSRHVDTSSLVRGEQSTKYYQDTFLFSAKSIAPYYEGPAPNSVQIYGFAHLKYYTNEACLQSQLLHDSRLRS